MAEVKPLNALHYDLDRAGALDDLTAPPYDVITPQMRETLIDRSEHNVVELDLPQDPSGGDIYAHAAKLLEAWKADGTLVEDGGPALWALTQDYTGPDGNQYTRRGFLAAIGVTDYGAGKVRPHERTQPGPKEDRLRLTRATSHNLSPIFVLHEGDAMRHLEDRMTGEPWGEATDADGTVNRVWRIDDPAVHEAVAEELAEQELLIADGHHRYETARVYADEIGGDGPHRYTLACLVSMQDPGLTVFATNRLLTGLDQAKQEAIRDAVMEHFDITEVERDSIVPPREAGPAAFGYIDSHHKKAYHLTLKDESTLDSVLDGFSDAYRHLDAAALEAIFLRGALGLSEDDIAAKRGLAYDSSLASTLERVESGDVDAAFCLRPTPVSQVREVAGAGENMPPKSTYFYPKLLTGIVFNPVG